MISTVATVAVVGLGVIAKPWGKVPTPTTATTVFVAVEITEQFDPMLCSDEFGSTKPSRTLFDGVIARTRLAPESVVLLDDSEQNVIGARQAGWRAIHFDSVETAATRLEEMGVFGLHAES